MYMYTNMIFIYPCTVDAVYEGFYKRTFAAAGIIAVVHLPFFCEFIVLFKRMGPRIDKETHYHKLKQTLEESIESSNSNPAEINT